MNQTITVVTTTSPTQFDALGTTEIIADGTLQASAVSAVFPASVLLLVFFPSSSVFYFCSIVVEVMIIF